MQSLFDQHDAERFMADLLAEVDRRIAAALATQDGAHRAYAWSIGDPTATPAPPPPYRIELRARPVDVVAQCLTAPSGTASFDVQRSIDGGVTWASILVTPATIAAGAYAGAGATFKWQDQTTRALVAPLTAGAFPLVLEPGDLIKLVDTPSGAKSLSIQLRVQRVGEYAMLGR